MADKGFLAVDDRSWERSYKDDLPDVPEKLQHEMDRTLDDYLQDVDPRKEAAVA